MLGEKVVVDLNWGWILALRLHLQASPQVAVRVASAPQAVVVDIDFLRIALLAVNGNTLGLTSGFKIFKQRIDHAKLHVHS